MKPVFNLPTTDYKHSLTYCVDQVLTHSHSIQEMESGNWEGNAAYKTGTIGFVDSILNGLLIAYKDDNFRKSMKWNSCNISEN